MAREIESGMASLLAFVVGVAAGAVAGLLLAPKPGEETRDQIRDFAQDAVDLTRDYAQTMQEKARSLVRGESPYEEGLQRVREKAAEPYHPSTPQVGPEPVDPFRKVS